MINKGLEKYAILDSSGMPAKDPLINKISELRKECLNDIKEYTKTRLT